MNKKPINDWQQEWVGMPEFVQENKQPVQKIVVSFESQKDVDEFAKITGYKITNKTKSLWFPYREKDRPRDWGYFDE